MTLNDIWFNTKWQQNGMVSLPLLGKFWSPANAPPPHGLEVEALVHHAGAAGGEVEGLHHQLAALHVERHHPVLGVLLPALRPPPW